MTRYDLEHTTKWSVAVTEMFRDFATYTGTNDEI
jgi:hypothetical protein